MATTVTASGRRRAALAKRVEKIVNTTPVSDIHTHLYDPAFHPFLIWEALFVQHSPISEACRGVLTTLNLLGLDVKKRDLPALRRWFVKQNPEKHVTRCLELAGVDRICMTNSPFDDLERPLWEKGL